MSSKHFCLKWNSFQSSILSAFESLQNTEDLADVTLTCEGINLKAHKFILSACSPYFRTVFKENPCSHPIVILKDVAHTDLIAIVNFMYHGEVMVSEEQLSSFLETATILQVSGLISSNDSTSSKRINIQQQKKFRQRNLDSPEGAVKRMKTSPRPKKFVHSELQPENSQTDNFECVEVNTIKAENSEADHDSVEQYCSDVNENVEVIVSEKNDQGSILEAALEVRDKPSSILQRSLMSQPPIAKPPAIFSTEKQLNLQLQILDIPKAVFIPRKPPEMETEKRIVKSSSSESSESPSTFERPSDLLQQCIKIEGESCESSGMASPDGDSNFPSAQRNVDIQPHHSSQCGNCPHCGKVYSNQSALKYHVRLIHSDLTNMYCCHLCPEAFDYREGYKKHMAEVHCIRN